MLRKSLLLGQGSLGCRLLLRAGARLRACFWLPIVVPRIRDSRFASHVVGLVWNVCRYWRAVAVVKQGVKVGRTRATASQNQSKGGSRRAITSSGYWLGVFGREGKYLVGTGCVEVGQGFGCVRRRHLETQPAQDGGLGKQRVGPWSDLTFQAP
jgi:hypothetical protein